MGFNEQDTWHHHLSAMYCAQARAREGGQRQRVIREDGQDHAGVYQFHVVPIEDEPCS